jgi:hypothetical protein
MKCLKCNTGKVVNKADTYGVKRTCQGCGHTWNSLQDLEALAAPTITLSEAKAQEPEFLGVRPYVPPVDPVSSSESLLEAGDTEPTPEAKKPAQRKQRAKKGS